MQSLSGQPLAQTILYRIELGGPYVGDNLVSFTPIIQATVNTFKSAGHLSQ